MRTNYRVDAYDRIQARLRQRAEEPMRLECAWCHREIRPGREPTSHGICATCQPIHFPAPGQ